MSGQWMTPFIAFCVFVSINFIACKSDPKPKEEQRMGPFYFGKYADYFWFKPGTYWIYENNRTGELDTCTLTSIERDTVTLFYEHPMFKRWYTYESINYLVYTRHKYGYVNYSTRYGCMTCPTMDTFRVITRDFSRGLFKFPWNNSIVNSGFYPTMMVNDSTFNEVYRFDFTLDSGLPFWDDTKLLWGINGTAPYSSYYWASGVGLIQIKYKTHLSTGMDSAYWNLKSYKIIPY